MTDRISGSAFRQMMIAFGAVAQQSDIAIVADGDTGGTNAEPDHPDRRPAG